MDLNRTNMDSALIAAGNPGNSGRRTRDLINMESDMEKEIEHIAIAIER